MFKTILIADDHPLLLNGTKAFLESKGYTIVATASDGIEAYNKIIKHKPNYAILDFDMPKLNGLEIATQLKKNNSKTKVVILTLYKHSEIIEEVGKTIEGYVTKDSGLDEIVKCLQSLAENKVYISKNLRDSFYLENGSNTTEGITKLLTPAEVKILKYVVENYTSAQIAEALFVSKRTVEKHRSNVIKKIGLDSKNQNALFLWLQEHPEVFNGINT